MFEREALDILKERKPYFIGESTKLAVFRRFIFVIIIKKYDAKKRTRTVISKLWLKRLIFF